MCVYVCACVDVKGVYVSLRWKNICVCDIYITNRLSDSDETFREGSKKRVCERRSE